LNIYVFGILECVQMYYCEFSHLYNGPVDSIMIYNYQDPWLWYVWCVEACWSSDNLWRIHL